MPSTGSSKARSKNKMVESDPLVHLPVGWMWVRPGRRVFSGSNEGEDRTKRLEANNVLTQNIQSITLESSCQRLLRMDGYSLPRVDSRSGIRFRTAWKHERFLGASFNSLGGSPSIPVSPCARRKEAKVTGGSLGLAGRGQTGVFVGSEEDSELRSERHCKDRESRTKRSRFHPT